MLFWHQLHSLRLTHKLSERFVLSPDPDYEAKWRTVLRAYAEAVAHPQQCVLLFADELTYYRHATLKRLWQAGGRTVRRHLERQPGPNTKTRLVGAVNSLSGEVHYAQRSKVGRKALCTFLQTLRAAYPDACIAARDQRRRGG